MDRAGEGSVLQRWCDRVELRGEQEMSNEALVFVGTLTRGTPYLEGANGEGILVFVFDETTGRLTLQSKVKGVENPGYLSLHE
jgi:hypothetical protein